MGMDKTKYRYMGKFGGQFLAFGDKRQLERCHANENKCGLPVFLKTCSSFDEPVFQHVEQYCDLDCCDESDGKIIVQFDMYYTL